VRCNGGCRYSVVQTPSAKVSLILWKVLQEAGSRQIYTLQELSACVLSRNDCKYLVKR
jgi:hypothetical protein